MRYLVFRPSIAGCGQIFLISLWKPIASLWELWFAILWDPGQSSFLSYAALFTSNFFFLVLGTFVSRSHILRDSFPDGLLFLVSCELLLFLSAP